jgi:hypothetical protein
MLSFFFAIFKNIMNNNSLDLHGTKHANVFRKVDQFIGAHIQIGTNEVEIITGYSGEMKKLVNKVLIDYGITSEEAWGNPGKLIINLT